jgi:hypothetical protein
MICSLIFLFFHYKIWPLSCRLTKPSYVACALSLRIYVSHNALSCIKKDTVTSPTGSVGRILVDEMMKTSFNNEIFSGQHDHLTMRCFQGIMINHDALKISTKILPTGFYVKAVWGEREHALPLVSFSLVHTRIPVFSSTIIFYVEKMNSMLDTAVLDKISARDFISFVIRGETRLGMVVEENGAELWVVHFQLVTAETT